MEGRECSETSRGTPFNNSIALETLWKTLSNQSLTVFILFWGWLWEIGLDRECAVSGAWKSMPYSLLRGVGDDLEILETWTGSYCSIVSCHSGELMVLKPRGEMQLADGPGEAHVGDVCLA